MPLNLSQKQAVVAEVAEVAGRAHSVVAAEYRGLTVSRMTELRAKARAAGVYLRVVRNTLARRAVQETDFECMSDHLIGPLVLAFSQEEPSAAAKVLKDFSKDNDKLVIKLASIGGKLLQPSEIERLATLPSRDQALSRLMAVMKAPIGKLVQTLAAPHTKLVRVLAAVRDQKPAG